MRAVGVLAFLLLSQGCPLTLQCIDIDGVSCAKRTSLCDSSDFPFTGAYVPLPSPARSPNAARSANRSARNTDDCHHLLLDGLSADHVQAPSMGVFHRTTTTNMNRPVYRQANGPNYLYAYKESLWVIGVTIGEDDGGVLVWDKAMEPQQISMTWQTFSGMAWESAPSIKASCLGERPGDDLSADLLDAEVSKTSSATPLPRRSSSSKRGAISRTRKRKMGGLAMAESGGTQSAAESIPYAYGVQTRSTIDLKQHTHSRRSGSWRSPDTSFDDVARELSCDSFSLSGLDPLDVQHGMLGEYRVTQTTSNGRPVFRQQSGPNYMFNLDSVGMCVWVVGTQVGKDDVGMVVWDVAQHPKDITLMWKVWNTREWIDAPSLALECAGGRASSADPARGGLSRTEEECEAVEIAGLHDSHTHHFMMGTYTKHSRSKDGRAAYAQVGGSQYLFCMMESSIWAIGERLGVDDVGILVWDSAADPAHVGNTWQVWNGEAWQHQVNISVKCLRD